MLTATPLNSSMLKSTSYESKTKTLVITFASNGETFYYSDVPFHIFEGLLSAESPGKFYLANIKKVYEGRKMPLDTPASGGPFSDMPKSGMVKLPSEINPEQFDYPTQLPDQNTPKPWE